MTWAGFIELCWTLAPFAGFAAGYATSRVEIAHRRRQRAAAVDEYRFHSAPTFPHDLPDIIRRAGE